MGCGDDRSADEGTIHGYRIVVHAMPQLVGRKVIEEVVRLSEVEETSTWCLRLVRLAL